MAKSLPGRLMRDFEPSLTDRGNAYVGLADVGYCTFEFTACVNTAGNHVVVHSLKATPSFWIIRPSGQSENSFIAFEGPTAAGTSAIYYTAHAPWTTASQLARRARLIAFR